VNNVFEIPIAQEKFIHYKVLNRRGNLPLRVQGSPSWVPVFAETANNFPPSGQPQCLFPYSVNTSSGLYPEPDEYIPQLPHYFNKIHITIATAYKTNRNI
jgi:hypothetical protein